MARRGVKQVVVEVYRRAGSAALGRSAAQLAFYALFALFPALLMLVSLAAYVPLEGVTQTMLARLRPLLPQEGYALIERHVREVVGEGQPRLLSVGFVLALLAASRAIDAMRVALNRANGVTETRSLWRRQAMAFGMTLGLATLLLAALVLVLLGSRAGAAVAAWAGLSSTYAAALPWLRWPVTCALLLLAAALCYAVVPDVKLRFRYASVGAVFATATWLLATLALGWYAENFDRYNLAYGSIGGVMVLLTWLYISGLLFLLGAQLDAVWENRGADRTPAGGGEADEQPVAEP